MLRISVKNAQLGMTLARAVYDSLGKLVLDANTVLDTSHVPILERLDVRGLIVQDSRVDDVIVVPMISEETEATAVRIVHHIMDQDCSKLPQYVKVDLPNLERLSKTLLQGLYSTFLGEINIDGCISAPNYEYFHPVKATGLALILGKEAKLTKHEMANLAKASLMQNVGYALLPREVIGQLKAEDDEKSPEFRQHPQLGYEILAKEKDLDADVAVGVWHHHERWAGNGFPRGLKGENISIFGRIISIASTFHALVSSRHGQQPFSPPEAAEFIVAYSGEYFDPQLVQLFLKNAPLYPKGTMVRLNTGESGIVVETNVGYIGRPKIRICLDRNGKKVQELYEIDLTSSEQQKTTVKEILFY